MANPDNPSRTFIGRRRSSGCATASRLRACCSSTKRMPTSPSRTNCPTNRGPKAARTRCTRARSRADVLKSVRDGRRADRLRDRRERTIATLQKIRHHYRCQPHGADRRAGAPLDDARSSSRVIAEIEAGREEYYRIGPAVWACVTCRRAPTSSPSRSARAAKPKRWSARCSNGECSSANPARRRSTASFASRSAPRRTGSLRRALSPRRSGKTRERPGVRYAVISDVHGNLEALATLLSRDASHRRRCCAWATSSATGPTRTNASR